jgi:hypothetical protein
MAEVLGLTMVKINGLFELDVVNARWDVTRAVVQHVTAGGVVEAIGVEIPSGSLDEVIPKQGATDWRKLSDFQIDIYDKETRKILLFSASGCNWDKVSGSSDLGSATTKKAITWKGTDVNTLL